MKFSLREVTTKNNCSEDTRAILNIGPDGRIISKRLNNVFCRAGFENGAKFLRFYLLPFLGQIQRFKKYL